MTTTAREVAKHAAERLLVSSGTAALARRRRREDILILAYHNVVPDDALPTGDRSLHLARRDFAAQLDLLLETHDVVPLGEALALARSRGTTSRRRPVAAITFDDAYRGALTLGTAELRARRLPATVFVAPNFVGGRTFWWDEVVWPSDSAEGDAFRARALDERGGDDARVRAAAAEQGYGARAVPDHARCASEEELRAAVMEGGLTPASHSWSHPNLARLAGERLRAELARPLAWLRERFPDALPILAYPYGRWSQAVAEAARGVGYEAALRVDGGWVTRDATNPHALPRLDVPAGLTDAGFALRTAGLFCR